MRRLKQQARVTRSVDKAVITETFAKDSKSNPEGSARTKQRTTRKTRKVAASDSRAYGCGAMRRELGRIGLKAGWLESVALRIRGARDGRRGLPRADRDGRWRSPLMAKEQHAVETYVAQKWAEHEMSVYEKQEDINRLDLQIASLEAAAAQAREREPAPPTEHELGEKTGQEQGAPPAVIRARRHNEWKKRTAGYYAAMKALTGKAEELKGQRAELLAAVDESACVTRLVCEKKRDLHLQRMDTYYHGALKTHPERATMPPVPEIVWENLAENLYNGQHIMKGWAMK